MVPEDFWRIQKSEETSQSWYDGSGGWMDVVMFGRIDQRSVDKED